MGIIYLIRNTINGKVYVGQTTGTMANRFSDHVYCASRESGLRIHQAIRKYGRGSFTIEQIDGSDSESDLNSKETAHIAAMNSCDYAHGYNMEPGGFGNSKEKREALSRRFSGKGNPMFGKPGTNLGKKHSESHCSSISAGLRGKKRGPMAEGHKEKLRISHLGEKNHFFGKTHSEESRAKNSASKLGVPINRKPNFDPYTGPVKFCECGCGLLAPLAAKTIALKGVLQGYPLRFVHGHNPSNLPGLKRQIA
jgi:group I intron endonuclease